jgi:hypothetical protein
MEFLAISLRCSYHPIDPPACSTEQVVMNVEQANEFIREHLIVVNEMNYMPAEKYDLNRIGMQHYNDPDKKLFHKYILIRTL